MPGTCNAGRQLNDASILGVDEFVRLFFCFSMPTLMFDRHHPPDAKRCAGGTSRSPDLQYSAAQRVQPLNSSQPRACNIGRDIRPSSEENKYCSGMAIIQNAKVLVGIERMQSELARRGHQISPPTNTHFRRRGAPRWNVSGLNC